MSEAGPSPVEALRTTLHAASEELAQAQELARQRADALILTPTRELQQARDAALGEVELIDLRIARLRKDLAQAEQQAREEERLRLLGLHADEVVSPAQAAAAQLLGHLGGLELTLGELNGLRNKARSITGQLRALGDAEASLQLNLRPDRDVQRRLERLLAAYDQALRPVG
jgi:hypothetical protein